MLRSFESMVLLTVGWRPVYLVPSRYVAVRGKLLEAEERMRYAVALAGPASRHPMYLRTLLAYAPIRQTFGDRAGARALFGEACALIDEFEDPGQRLLALLDQTKRKLRLAPRRRGEPGQELSDQELKLLRLLARDLHRHEIADSLHLSVNTVKSHLRSIYRKLGATSREEAVQRARQLSLIS